MGFLAKILFFIALPFRLIKIFFFYKKQDLSKHPFLINNFAPVKNELQHSTDVEVVEGQIPKDLDGVYVRNGPNPKYPFMNDQYHWFDGDGYLHEMELKDGKVLQYKGTYTKTERYQMEEKAGKRLFPLLAELMDIRLLLKFIFGKIISSIFSKQKPTGKFESFGTANTSIEFHNKRFLTLVESDVPYQVLLPELKTVGRYDFEGKLTHSFTAHPKVDPVTGELLFFGYNALKRPYLTYSVVSKEGKLVRDVPIDIGPYGVMSHDFAITENYSVFLVFPLAMDLVDMLQGKSGFTLKKDVQAKVGVIKRHGEEKDIQWFDISNGYSFHTVNAWEEGKVIHLYACKSKDLVLTNIGTDLSSKDNGPVLYKWSLDLEKNKVLFDAEIEKERIFCEFPTIDPSLLGRKTRFCYVSNIVELQKAVAMNSVSKFDLEKNQRIATLELGENCYGGEFFFVSKKGAKSEDDGYLMSFVHDEKKNKSYFYILDSLNLKLAAKLALPHRVPYGFHGKFINRQQLDTQIETI